MLTENEAEAVIDALALVIALDDDLAGFASVARTMYLDESCGSEIRCRFATVMRPRLVELQQRLALGAANIRNTLKTSPETLN